MNAAANPLKRVESTVIHELRLLEAQQMRHVEVGPDEEMTVETLWTPEAAQQRDRLTRALAGLTLAA